MDGRKIPREIENPIDNVLIDISYFFNKNINPNIITPNILTTIGLISGIGSSYFIYNNNFLPSALLHTFAYFMECMEGSNARIYKKSSKFGDMYDHIADRIRGILLVLAIVFNKIITRKEKIIFLVVLFIAFILLIFHMSCQEKNIILGPKSTYLKMFDGLCSSKKYITFSRFFGCGTFNFIILLFLLYFYFTKNNINKKIENKNR